MKIVSRKSLDVQSVFDIGLEHDHNFLLDNGYIASNCFNKSHSVAYGYVTYQTAYLKAHYAPYFYAAVLSNESNDTTKIYKYSSELRSSGLKLSNINEIVRCVDLTLIVHVHVLFGRVHVSSTYQ